VTMVGSERREGIDSECSSDATTKFRDPPEY
jgi:hypothetical protein